MHHLDTAALVSVTRALGEKQGAALVDLASGDLARLARLALVNDPCNCHAQSFAKGSAAVTERQRLAVRADQLREVLALAQQEPGPARQALAGFLGVPPVDEEE